MLCEYGIFALNQIVIFDIFLIKYLSCILNITQITNTQEIKSNSSGIEYLTVK